MKRSLLIKFVEKKGIPKEIQIAYGIVYGELI